MNLLFYRKCLSPRLPTVTSKGVKYEVFHFFCMESSSGTTISGGMFYAAA